MYRYSVCTHEHWDRVQSIDIGVHENFECKELSTGEVHLIFEYFCMYLSTSTNTSTLLLSLRQDKKVYHFVRHLLPLLKLNKMLLVKVASTGGAPFSLCQI